MSIATEIESTRENVQKAYDSLNKLGETATNQNIENISGLIDNIYDKLPKTSYFTGTAINLGKTIKAKLDYEDDILGYGNAEQEGTPTPTEPIPISVVTGEQDVVVRGKNILNLINSHLISNGITTDIVDETINCSGTATASWTNLTPANNRIPLILKANKTYTFWRNQVLSTPLTMRIYFSDNTYQGVAILQNTNKITFTPTQDVVSMYLFIGGGLTSGQEFSISNLKLMVYEGTEDSTEWEGYIESTTTTIDLGDLELAKIGDYADEIVYDEEADKFYKEKVINKVIFNGTENWKRGGVTSISRYYLEEFSNIIENLGLCDYYSLGLYANRNNVNENLKFFIGTTSIQFRKDDISSIDDFKTWLTTHNTEVYYVLASETLEEITNNTLIEELNNLYNMQSVNGTTIIEVNGTLPLILKVRGIKGE